MNPSKSAESPVFLGTRSGQSWRANPNRRYPDVLPFTKDELVNISERRTANQENKVPSYVAAFLAQPERTGGVTGFLSF